MEMILWLCMVGIILSQGYADNVGDSLDRTFSESAESRKKVGSPCIKRCVDGWLPYVEGSGQSPGLVECEEFVEECDPTPAEVVGAEESLSPIAIVAAVCIVLTVIIVIAVCSYRARRWKISFTPQVPDAENQCNRNGDLMMKHISGTVSLPHTSSSSSLQGQMPKTNVTELQV